VPMRAVGRVLPVQGEGGGNAARATRQVTKALVVCLAPFGRRCVTYRLLYVDGVGWPRVPQGTLLANGGDPS
jgi:hypothetical protein